MSKDVKKMVAEIAGALERFPREQLQEILAYVFKEYVVEGGTSAAGALSMLDARTELEGLSFAELMTWLQLHLDVPELALFEVAGGRVQVRAGGRSIPLEAARVPEPLPVAPPAAAPASVTTAPQPMPPQPMPRPTPAASPQPMPPPLAPTPSHQAPPAASANSAPAGDDKKDDPQSPASRFSWLEVD